MKAYIAPFNMFNNLVLKGDTFLSCGDIYYAEKTGFSLSKEIVETWEQANPHREMIKEWEESGRKKIVQFFADGEWRSIKDNDPLWHHLDIYRFKPISTIGDNSHINTSPDYQKLKDENQKLKQDIYNLVCNSDKIQGIEVKLIYEACQNLANTVLQGTPTILKK